MSDKDCCAHHEDQHYVEDPDRFFRITEHPDVLTIDVRFDCSECGCVTFKSYRRAEAN